MSENKARAGAQSGVSKGRTIASLIVLVVAGVVCFIEMRAFLGHYLTASALKKKCNKLDEFQNVTLKDAQDMVRFATSMEEKKQDADTSYQYTWYSLLRPLTGDATPTLTIIATNGANPMALSFHTESGEDVPDSAGIPAQPAQGSPQMPGGMMGPGGMGPGGMGPGGMGPGGGRGGRERPPVEGEPEPGDGAKDDAATGAPASAAPSDARAAHGAERPAAEKSDGEAEGTEKPSAEKPADPASVNEPPTGDAATPK
ncbi:MAG: hypothetical protein ACK58L_08890 [Planctomycetota bacterium]